MAVQEATKWPGEWLLGQAETVVSKAAEAGFPARLIGGVGVYAATESSRAAPLRRDYGDFDLIVPSGHGRDIGRVMETLGYEGKRQFNALHGSHRQIYADREARFAVDVLIGTFTMCHRLDLSTAFYEAATHAPRHLLLLTKLQIVQIEPKDLMDSCSLLLDWVRNGLQEPFLDARALANTLSHDWGLHHTVGLNLKHVTEYAAGVLGSEDGALVGSAVAALQKPIADAPKGVRWKARARVGERLRWYELPEDV